MQLFAGFDAQFAQFFGAADEIAPAGNQAAIGRLKLGLSLTERFIDAVHAFDKADKFVIKFAACLGNGQCVLVLLLVAPDVGNGAQGGEQGAGAGQHDAFVETLLEEVWIMLQGEEIGRFDRDEHKDEVQRFDALKVSVIFAAKLLMWARMLATWLASSRSASAPVLCV